VDLSFFNQIYFVMFILCFLRVSDLYLSYLYCLTHFYIFILVLSQILLCNALKKILLNCFILTWSIKLVFLTFFLSRNINY